MMPPPDPLLIERFARDLARLASPDARLLLAVSGGADSLAMLVLASNAIPGRIACATVNHGLRAEAAAEAAMVAGVCAVLGVAHAILNVAMPPGSNVQARARTARYDALAVHAAHTGCTAILTAHHADDQAETLLMRASRGSGVDGLAGVRAAGSWGDLPLLRPLLGWRKDDLKAIVADAGLHPVDDPANHDPAHDRSRFRALIADSDDLDVTGLARSAATLADASDALRWTLDRLAVERIAVTDDGRTIDVRDLPREYRRRLLVHALAEMGEPAPRGPALDRLLAMLDRGGGATLGSTRAMADGALWRLAPAPQRKASL